MSQQAFMSYAQFDDNNSYLSQFRQHLSDEIQSQMGQPFPIMVANDIPWGNIIDKHIGETLSTSMLFIPIITPSYLKNTKCCEQLQQFAARKPYILPVYYIECPEMEGSGNAITNILKNHKYMDWRNLRNKPFDDDQAQKMLQDMAKQIVEAMRRTTPDAPTQTPAYKLGDTSEFDLQQFEQEFLNKLPDQRGMVGFLIPCDNETFRTCACERLKGIVCNKPLVNRLQPFGLSRKSNPPATVIQKMQRQKKYYQEQLRVQDLLLPLHLMTDDEQTASNLASEFWCALNQAFNADFWHSVQVHDGSNTLDSSYFIVLIFSSVDCTLPENVGNIIRLQAPTFSNADLHTWIRDVIKVLNWTNAVLHTWRNIVQQHCTHGTSLDMHMVYQLLEDTLALIREREGLSEGEFLARWKDIYGKPSL